MPDRPTVRLYSASPRRRELMDRLGIPYEAVPVAADERPPEGVLSPEKVVLTIAMRKLESGLSIDGNSCEWGIAADTMVEGPSGLLGKPSNEEEAYGMIAGLSGRTHTVHSGIAVYASKGPRGDSETAMSDPCAVSDAMGGLIADGSGTVRCLCHSTRVAFRRLSEAEIRSYVESDEWKGAAGAYRIQGLGAVLIDRIEGLWSTVVGLPLAPLYGILTALSYPMG